MTRFTGPTTFAALFVALTTSSAAMADPYADTVASLSRVETGSPGLSTSVDDGDLGTDALGAPDFQNHHWDTITALGYDASTGQGGTLVLAFQDNTCIDGAGSDLMIHEGFSNESMEVAVSSDDGVTFVPLGNVGPGAGEAGYELDLAGVASSVNQVRLVATDFFGNKGLAGADVDAVECLNSVVPPQSGAYMDGCDLGGGDAGVDVEEVLVSSDGFSIDVSMTLCGPVAERAKYMVAFDYKSEAEDDKYRKYRSWFRKYSWFKRRPGGHDDDDDDDHDNGDMEDPSGPDSLNPNARCYSRDDAVATYYRGREYGVGLFTVEGDKLTLTVDYGELGLAMGSEVLVWVKTLDKRRIGDTVPTVESGDRCSRPQVAAEVLPLTLE